jgi:hypothetical protein
MRGEPADDAPRDLLAVGAAVAVVELVDERRHVRRMRVDAVERLGA